MESAVEKIKERIDIVELIGSYMTLKKAGRNFKGLCPFHQEKTPSFVVSPDRQLWRCFGSCGIGGDAIAFVMKYENLSFPETIKELGEKYGVEIKDFIPTDTHADSRERLLQINKRATEYYHYVLTKTSIGKNAYDYLIGRGLNPKIIDTFQLGYSPSSWDSFYRFAMKKEINTQDLIECGLCIRKSGGGVYDRFRGRVMFPLKDHRGNTVGFSGRILTGESEAKYINSPETSLYHKRTMLFGLHLVKEAIKKQNVVTIVEGEFDMITPYQHGIDTIVAIKGSALTAEQLQLIKRYTNKVNLALDADAAGEEAIRRAIEVAEPLGFELGVIIVPEGKDPDEAVRHNEPAFRQAMKKPVPVYDFLIDLFIKKYPPSDPFSKKMIGDEMAPFLFTIMNPIVQSYYVKQLAKLLDVSEDSIHKVVHGYRKKRFVKKNTADSKPKSVSVSREQRIQEYFIGSLLQMEKVSTVIRSFPVTLDAEDFNFPAYGMIFAELSRFTQNVDSAFDINAFAGSLRAELRAVVDDLYMKYSMVAEKNDVSLTGLSLEIRANGLKNRIHRLLIEASDRHDEEISKLQLELKEVEKKHSAS